MVKPVEVDFNESLSLNTLLFVHMNNYMNEINMNGHKMMFHEVKCHPGELPEICEMPSTSITGDMRNVIQIN